MLCSHFTQNCILLYFLEAKNPYILWQKIVENLLIFLYLFCQKNGATDFTKTFITQEWMVVESCPTPRWIAFLMLYRLMYNIRSHFNKLTLVWRAYSYEKSVQDKISFPVIYHIYVFGESQIFSCQPWALLRTMPKRRNSRGPIAGAFLLAGVTRHYLQQLGKVSPS